MTPICWRLLLRPYDDKNNPANDRRYADNRRKRYGPFLFHGGVEVNRPSVEDLLLFVRRETEAAVGERRDAQNDEEDSNNTGRFHT